MKYADLTSKMRERTRPDPSAVARVRARLDRALVPATAELSGLPQVSPGAVARVKARLAARPAPRRVPVWAGVGLALAAVAGVAGLWSMTGRPPERGSHALTGAGALAVASERLVLTHDGEGRADVDGDLVRIDWDYGRLELAVPTDLRVQVVTPEGRVEAGGAGLVVVRDALGTRVEVSEGQISARCGEGQAESLSSGAVACDPLTAAGWLNRARAREDQHATPDVILGDLDRGLVLPDAVDAVKGELLTMRADALLEAGRHAEALSAVEAALATPIDLARAEALHRTAARLSLLAGDCARALPHLEQLPALTADEQAHKDRCTGG